MMPKTKDAMRGKWESALSAYGLSDKQLSGKHCECPICGGSDRFRFDNKDEIGTWFCNQCGAGEGFKLLMMMTGRGFHDVASDLDKRIGNFDTTEARAKPESSNLIGVIAKGITAISDIDPVTRYLRSRGINKIPREFLRYNAAAFHWGEQRNYPAMIAALRDVDGRAKGYHVTYLTDRGAKAGIDKSRMYTPGKTGECVIRLSAIAEHIGLAEGIETALSVTQLYGVPCWATGDAGRMERFIPPAGVDRVTVFCDMDENHTGEAAAESLAKRLIIRNGIRCEVRRDCARGTDYSDLLQAMNKEASNG